MIDAFKKGLYSYITTSSFYNYLTGKLYSDEYPQSTSVVYPNMIYHRITNSPTRDSHGYFEPIYIQFNLYTDEDTIVNSKKGNDLMDFLEDQFISLMDDATFSVTGYGMVKCNRIFTHPLPKDDEERVWGRAIQYLIEIEEV